MLSNLNTGYDLKVAPTPCDKLESQLLSWHNDKPVSYTEEIQPNPESIADSISTGFDVNNKLVKECPKQEYKRPLYKENHLNEFDTEIDKSKARDNLEIYSKDEINLLFEIFSDNSDVIDLFINFKTLIEKFIQDNQLSAGRGINIKDGKINSEFYLIKLQLGTPSELDLSKLTLIPTSSGFDKYICIVSENAYKWEQIGSSEGVTIVKSGLSYSLYTI